MMKLSELLPLIAEFPERNCSFLHQSYWREKQGTENRAVCFQDPKSQGQLQSYRMHGRAFEASMAAAAVAQ